MIRRFTPEDRSIFLEMSDEFYHTHAVDHVIPRENMTATFDTILKGSPYADGVILTYSGEVGGLSVLLEELYIREEYRSAGLGKSFFAWTEEQYPEAKRFRLEVTESNTRAEALYRRLGFERLSYIQMIKDR